jgi:prophage regulatory protein
MQTMKAATAAVDRLIRWDDVRRLVGLGRSTIFRLERAGDFPKRVALTARCVAWRESDVVAWLNARQ